MVKPNYAYEKRQKELAKKKKKAEKRLQKSAIDNEPTPSLVPEPSNDGPTHS